MARRPSYLHALAAAVTAAVLAVGTPAVPAAASPQPDPPAPAPPVGAAQGGAPQAEGRTAQDRPRKRRAPAQDDYDAPLDITIEELTPGELPRRGPLTVRGTITNVDLETWEGINLYPVFSVGPGCEACSEVMTTVEQLDQAAASDPEAPVGERYTEVRDDVAELDPGESATYSIKVPQRVLRQLFGTPEAGVYWFGVHASGSSEGSPRDGFADGRARTFLPYVPASSEEVVDTAVVVPLRGPITHTADGQLGRTPGWQRSLSPDGDLGGPLAFGAASGADPVTWLVDPALPDAVRHLARGNLPREIEPVPQDPDDPSPSPEASEETDDDAGSAADDSAEEAGIDPAARAAESWLRQAEIVLDDDHVATLPYGDPDLAAAATGLPDLYEAAREHRGTVLSDWGVEGTPVVAPPNGYLDAAGIQSVSDGALVVLGDRSFRAEDSVRPPATGTVGDRPLVVRSSGAAEGGPGPDPRLAPVAMRQRILSEAAVRLLQSRDDPEPLVVVLPTSIDAAGASRFWAGLDVPWLRLVDLRSVRAQIGSAPEEPEVDPDRLSYPPDQEQLELDRGVLLELDGLIRDARSLQSILGEQYRIAGRLMDEALAGASYALRGDPQAAPRLERTRGWVREQLDQVSVDAPSGVTLSGTSGSFNVAVRNTLDFPVTVQVEATTDSGARIGVANPVVLAANSRSSVPVSADMSRPGVHNVTLRLTDLEGEPIGASDELPIRSGQVGVVIWAIIGSGLAILLVAIGIRLFRRIRASGGRRGSEPVAATSGGDS